MARFVALGMVTFDGGSQSDAWAQGNAQWLKDNTQVLAQQAALVAPGTAGERTSWISAWHLNAAGEVTQGLPDAAP